MDQADTVLVSRSARAAARAGRGAVRSAFALVVFAASLACASAGPESARADGVPEGWAAATAPDTTALVSGDWRLSSPVFSEMPVGGYQVRFVAGGHVASDNLAGVEGWTLVGGRLLLYGADKRIVYQFQWDDDAGVFQRLIEADERGAPPITIARFDRPSAHEATAKREAAKPFVLPGAVIGTADDARRLALQAYFQAGGVRALESVDVSDAFRVATAVAGFAGAGDRVWEVRVHETADLSAIIWINAQSGAAYFLYPLVDAAARETRRRR